MIFCLIIVSDSLAAEIIAHRGYSCPEAQNTLASVERAWLAGADAVEVDVRVSSDSVTYLFHDDKIGARRVHSLSYAEIAQSAGSGAPKLASILNLDNVPGYYLIDMKEREPDRVRVVVSAILGSRLDPDQIMFQSEDPSTLALLDELLPASRTMYLSRLKREFPYLDAPGPKRIIRKLHRLEVDGISLKGRSFVDKPFVDELKAAGYHVNVWTINDPSRAAFYREIGVDGIITDAVEGIQVTASKSRVLAVPCS